MQIKIFLTYFLMAILNYGFLCFLNIGQGGTDISKIERASSNNIDKLFYVVFMNEQNFLLAKIFVKFIKLVIDLTSINLQKTWDYRRPIFSLMSFARLTFKIFIEIKFCFTLVKLGHIPILFIIDCFFSIINLVKQFIKLYDNYRISLYINR
jgi:hypothetical protein